MKLFEVRSVAWKIVMGALFVFAIVNVRYLTTEAWPASPPPQRQDGVMLILRGIASADRPRGQLDDSAALEYARRLGFQGEVLNVAGSTGADSAQVRSAMRRIHHDRRVRAIYGFSGGGYNARHIWKRLNPNERHRVRKVVVIGSPGVTKGDFPGTTDVLIRRDPPAGHLAGPRALLRSLDRDSPAQPSRGVSGG